MSRALERPGTAHPAGHAAAPRVQPLTDAAVLGAFEETKKARADAFPRRITNAVCREDGLWPEEVEIVDGLRAGRHAAPRSAAPDLSGFRASTTPLA